MTKQHGGAIVDMGNVIIAYRLSGLTTENYEQYDFDSIPENPGCFETLKWLNGKFGGNISIVWKSTNDAVGNNIQWLKSHNFTELTGIPMERIHRIGEDRQEKTNYIHQFSQTHFGTTVVVDDRLEVLSHFVDQVPNLFLFRFQVQELGELRRKEKLDQVISTCVADRVRQVQTWMEIRKALQEVKTT